MTDAAVTDLRTDEQLGEAVRPLVNDILARFNEEQRSPSEVGMVILGLTYRLLAALKEAPEAQRHFIGHLVGLINSYLAGELEE
jgi:hypothetical protein